MKFLSVAQVVEYTGRTEREVRGLIRRGLVKVERIGYNIAIPESEARRLKEEVKDQNSSR